MNLADVRWMPIPHADDDRGTLTDRPQAVDGEQDLVLPPAPGSSGVDMK